MVAEAGLRVGGERPKLARLRIPDDGDDFGLGAEVGDLGDRNTPTSAGQRRRLRRSGNLAQAGETFRAVDDPEQMPAGASVFEEAGVGLEALTDYGRPLGRLVDFDEEQRGGLAGVENDELVGLHAVSEVRDVGLGQPELDEPRIEADERGDELYAVEGVAERDEAG